MDAKKAYGVEQALGRALAPLPDALPRLRAADSADALLALVPADARIPRALVEEYVAGVGDWPKARAKLLQVVKVAQGTLKAGEDHKAGKGVGRP